MTAEKSEIEQRNEETGRVSGDEKANDETRVDRSEDGAGRKHGYSLRPRDEREISAGTFLRV